MIDMIDMNTAKTELQKRFDVSHSSYSGNVSNEDEAKNTAIEAWADALFYCVLNIIPSSLTVLAAKDAFTEAAEGMHLDGAVFQVAVNIFAETLGAGMIGYSANAPEPTPFVGVVSCPITPFSSPVNGEVMCNKMAQEMTAWFALGTATNNVSGVTINWS